MPAASLSFSRKVKPNDVPEKVRRCVAENRPCHLTHRYYYNLKTAPLNHGIECDWVFHPQEDAYLRLLHNGRVIATFHPDDLE